MKMAPIGRKIRDKDIRRHNPYFRATKNTRERLYNEKDENLSKNVFGGVINRLLSTLNWTYTSIFGKNDSNNSLILPSKNDKKQLPFEYLDEKKDESMLSASLAPHLFGYTPQTVRIRQHPFKDIACPNSFEKQKECLKFKSESLIDPIASNKSPITGKHKRQLTTSIIPSYNENNFQNTNNSFYSDTCSVSKRSAENNVKKINTNVKSNEFLLHHLNSEEKKDSKKLQKNSSSNNHLTFDCFQWPRNSSTGILTAWREICKQQEILLKNNMAEQQLHRSKQMFLKENVQVKNIAVDIHTNIPHTNLNDITLNSSKNERKENIIEIQKRKDDLCNKLKDTESNFINNISNLKQNNVEKIKPLKKNMRSRQISENLGILSPSNLEKKELGHKKNKSCSFPLRNTKESLVQKKADSQTSNNNITEHLKTPPDEVKPILKYNAQKNQDFKNIEIKNDQKSSKKINMESEIFKSKNSLFIDSQHKRKRSGYFSALEEDLEEMFGPYNDMDDNIILVKKRKNNEINKVDYKKSINDLQKHNLGYQQPYFQPRVPLLKEYVDDENDRIYNSFKIGSPEKSNLSTSPLKIKQIPLNGNNGSNDSELDLNKKENFTYSTKETENNDKCKIFQFNADVQPLIVNRNTLDDKKLEKPNDVIVTNEQSFVNNINCSQHNNLNNTHNISFLSSAGKKDPLENKIAHGFAFDSSNQQLVFNTASQKDTDSLDNKRAETVNNFSSESSTVKTDSSKLQNSILTESKLPTFTFNTDLKKTTDILQTNNDIQTTHLEKTVSISSTNTNIFQPSQDITQNQPLVLTKPTDTFMEMNTSPEKKEIKLQSKTTDFNFITPNSDHKIDSKTDESIKLEFNKDNTGHKMSVFTPIIPENTKTGVNESQIFTKKPSALLPQNNEEKIPASSEDVTKKTSLDHSFSTIKSSELSDFKNTNFSFKSATIDNNKPQTPIQFSFFGSVDNFAQKEKPSVQTNMTNEEQKEISSNDKPEFNFTQSGRQPSSIESNQVPNTSFTFGQNTQSSVATSNTTPIFSFGLSNQPKQTFSFNQSTPNTFSFQSTPNNPPVFQFGGNKNETNTHEFTFNLNNTMTSGSITSSTPSAPAESSTPSAPLFVFGQSTNGSSNTQTVPSFNFGTNNNTMGNFSLFQSGQFQSSQPQTTNMNFSFGTPQNTLTQGTGTPASNPFAFTFNATSQSPIPGRKIAAPKSRLRRR